MRSPSSGHQHQEDWHVANNHACFASPSVIRTEESGWCTWRTNAGTALDNYSHRAWILLLCKRDSDITLPDRYHDYHHHHHRCHVNHSLTLTSRSESRNLSWRFVSMCSWFPASRSACSLLLGMAVWSLGASSMSISTSCHKPQQRSYEWAFVTLLSPVIATNKSRGDQKLWGNK